MANSAIGSTDLAKLRSAQSVENLTVHITPLTVVQSGTITAIPTTEPYVSVTWDGSTTGIAIGQMVKITSGSTVVSYAVIRKAPSGSTLFISTTPLGSAGYTTEIETAIAVGQTVTVYNHHPLWGLYSRINQRIFYKSYDVAYASQNLNIPPVANTGEWQCGTIASGDTTAAFTLPRDGTSTSFAMAGTVSSHLWTLPSGVTLQAGYATSDSVIEVDAEAGYHLISYRVTDSNAQTHTAYVWLFVSDGTTGQSLDERYKVSAIKVSQGQKGFTGSFTITGTDLQDVLYPGAGILIKETPNFNGSQLTDGVFVDTFIAYLVSADYTYSEGRISSATVQFESPVLYANRVVQPEQSLREVSGTPANWTQCTSALSNPRGAFYYAVKWHTPALLDMHDVIATSMTTPRRKDIAYNTKTLGAAIDLVDKLFLIHTGSAADGTTVLTRRPMYMSNTDRNNLAVRMTWLAQDLRLPVRFTENWLSQLSESTTGAFWYTGSATGAALAGKRWYQGSGSSEMPNFTVTSSEGVTRIRDVSGHYHAEQNRPIRELKFLLTGNQDVIDPAWNIWDRLTIAAQYDPRGIGWSNARMLATRVDRTWDKSAQGYEKTIDVSWQPETFGQPGKQIPIGSARVNQDTVTVVPFAPEVIGNVGLMIAVNETGQLAITYDYLSDSPQWTDLSGLFDGDVCDFDWDYNSGFFTGGYSITSELSVYVCTIEDTTFRVYRIYDAKAAVLSATELTSATMSDSSMNTNGRIVCSKTTPTYCIAVWKDQTGVEEIHTTDGGATWSSKANVGNAVTDTANDDAPIGLDVLGTTTLVTAPDSTPEYGLYIATSAGGVFSAVSGTERDSVPNPMIKLLTTGSAYVTKKGTASSETTETVTFDAGGYAYTLNAGTNSAPAVEAQGNPDNCAREEGSSGSNQAVDFNIDIELGSVVPVTSLSFDVWHLSRNSVFTYVNTEYRVNFYNGITLVDFFTVWAWQAEREEWHNTTEIDVTGSEPTLPDATAIDTWLASGPYADGIECDRINIDINNTNQVNLWDWRIDNIAITYGVAGTSRALYKVTTLGGTSVWTDVSPTTDKAPIRPHDLAIDIVDSDVINTVADDDNWYQSTDAASNWTTKESSTDKRTPYSVGDAIVFGGASEVQLTLDNGTSEDAKTGNLSAVWGTIGTIKKVLAV